MICFQEKMFFSGEGKFNCSPEKIPLFITSVIFWGEGSFFGENDEKTFCSVFY